MNVMDAKIISTQYGLETYLDVVKSVDVRGLHYPTETEPFFEITVGIEYFLLKEERYYDSRKNFFRIRMNSDFGSVTLVETKMESLFAVKNAGEKDATKELIGEWLIKTQAFKQVINELIVQKKNGGRSNRGGYSSSIRNHKVLGEITRNRSRRYSKGHC
ncbi:hypothetical protein R7236_14050 [Priestia megaterium]|uniref:hypothetical protein n=1 Tax=Priestia megaterium TaxID=1404 RepID=UPI0020D249DE|nr:hypothetical protein [Priestia megaterium]MDW4509522.1 hypothetical protein [Priestia megaterium]